MQDTLEIRNVTETEIQIVLDLAAQEGWNPGLQDGPAFFAADPNGFFCGLIRGLIVNVISVVRYSEDFGFVGLFICRHAYRAKGYGHQLWDRALLHLNGCKTIGLDAVYAQTSSYASHGFVSSYRNVRYVGTSISVFLQDSRVVEVDSTIHASLFGAILQYDTKIFLTERVNFLNYWLTDDTITTTIATDTTTDTNTTTTGTGISTHRSYVYIENNAVRGYGTIRKCHTGYKIAPLFADSLEIADILFRTLSSTVTGEVISIDIPEPNSSFTTVLLEQYKLAPVFETYRMYRGEALELCLDRIYGITSFELG